MLMESSERYMYVYENTAKWQVRGDKDLRSVTGTINEDGKESVTITYQLGNYGPVH